MAVVSEADDARVRPRRLRAPQARPSPDARGVPLRMTVGTPETPALLGQVERRCVFRYEDRRGGRCEIHRVLGHAALPLACRQFPRVSLLDPRGVCVTLSHYCPTARAMLDTAGAPVRILTSPAGFPGDGEYVGLDARDALPPLLRPNLLMDWESWWDWEAWSVDVLANSARPPADALAVLSDAVERLREWTPASALTLREALRDATSGITVTDGGPGSSRPCPTRTDGRSGRRTTEGRGPRAQGLVQDIFAAIPAGLDVPRPSGAAIDDGVLKRLLAAHAFANWMPHLGRGLRVWARWLQAVYALATSGYDVAQVDLLMRHLVEPNALAEAWSECEGPRPDTRS